MRRHLMLAAAACALASLSGSVGTAATVKTGTIHIGNPANPDGITGLAGQAAALASPTGAPCTVSTPTQGIDGFWIDLGSPVAGTAITITPTGATPDPVYRRHPADFDGWFFDAKCDFIDNDSLADGDSYNQPPFIYTQMGDTETGTIPAGAKYLLVVLWTGAEQTFRVNY